MTKEKQCPFGIRARFCKYQKTYAKDALSAIEGNLLFICALDKADDCLETERMINEKTRSPRLPRICRT
jgi:hypothetical protein